jgi:hypothetical protein
MLKSAQVMRRDLLPSGDLPERPSCREPVGRGLGRLNHEDCVRPICEQDDGSEQPTPVENGENKQQAADPAYDR